MCKAADCSPEPRYWALLRRHHKCTEHSRSCVGFLDFAKSRHTGLVKGETSQVKVRDWLTKDGEQGLIRMDLEGLPGGSEVKNLPKQCRGHRFDPLIQEDPHVLWSH